jgi:hypothetical protein
MWGLWVAHGHEARARQYDDSITALYHLVLLLLVIFIPFTYWRDAPTLAHYISTWPRFQVPTVTVVASSALFNEAVSNSDCKTANNWMILNNESGRGGELRQFKAMFA